MDWTTLIIGALIGGIVTLPLAVFANIATPWVLSFIKNSSLSYRERRIALLIKEYGVVYRYKTQSSRFTHILLIIIMGLVFLGIDTLIVIGLIITNIIVIPSDIATWGLVIFFSSVLLVCFYFFLFGTLYFLKVYGFKSFREKTLAKLKKLGGNPEDLDKEETA